jgi:hypothetical protein
MSSVAESFAHRRVLFGNVEPAAAALLKQLDPALVFLRTYGRTVLQCASVIAILLFIALAFKVGADLSRKVVLTWFGVRPAVGEGLPALFRFSQHRAAGTRSAAGKLTGHCQGCGELSAVARGECDVYRTAPV